jgi:4a-hydroxytetrahydrobiopterin dehydratase
LDRLGEFSETTQRFPDISFGKMYVNITLRPESDEADAVLTDADRSFAVEIDALIR